VIEIERVTYPGIRVAAAHNLIELAWVSFDGVLKHVDAQYAQ